MEDSLRIGFAHTNEARWVSPGMSVGYWYEEARMNKAAALYWYTEDFKLVHKLSAPPRPHPVNRSIPVHVQKIGMAIQNNR